MNKSLQRLRRRHDEGVEGGFTLIEIVIVILGILAAIVVFAVQNPDEKQPQATCGADYRTAVEAYKAQMDNYPSGSTAAVSVGS